VQHNIVKCFDVDWVTGSAFGL